MVTPTPVALPFSPPITMDDADVSRCLERRMAFVPRTNLSLFGEVRNRDFAAGGRRALLELPAAQANASARPRGSPYAVSIRINRQASPSGEEMTETAVSEFFWRRRSTGRP